MKLFLLASEEFQITIKFYVESRKKNKNNSLIYNQPKYTVRKYYGQHHSTSNFVAIHPVINHFHTTECVLTKLTKCTLFCINTSESMMYNVAFGKKL